MKIKGSTQEYFPSCQSIHKAKLKLKDKTNNTYRVFIGKGFSWNSLRIVTLYFTLKTLPKGYIVRYYGLNMLGFLQLTSFHLWHKINGRCAPETLYKTLEEKQDTKMWNVDHFLMSTSTVRTKSQGCSM